MSVAVPGVSGARLAAVFALSDRALKFPTDDVIMYQSWGES